MKKLAGQVALVTGASRGIGRAIALKLAEEGAQVVINYTSNHTEAEQTMKLMGDNQNNSCVMGFDVSDWDAVSQAVDNITSKYNKLDILVNNAGISIDNLIMRMKPEEFDRQIAVNLRGAFNTCKAVTRPMMKQRHGRIINISSVVGQMGNAGQCAYAAAKAGLIGLTKTLALELSSRNILVNSIAPGYISTDMTKELINKGGDSIFDHIPLGRVGEPKDIANAAAFLASSDADYITGQVLSVNGGLYI